MWFPRVRGLVALTSTAALATSVLVTGPSAAAAAPTLAPAAPVAAPAAGAAAGDPVLSSADPSLPDTVGADALPTWQINGVVWSQVIVGNTVYATGKFTKARPPGEVVGGPTEVDAANILAYDLRTGERIASFAHSLDAQGLVIRRSPDGSRIYVGGDFTTVDGQPRGHIAAFDTATGALVPTFTPSISGSVRAIAVAPTTVYAGGGFSQAAGTTVTNLAAFSLTGAPTGWKPSVTGLNPTVTTMVLAPNGASVVIGGSFETLAGTPSYGMGAVSLTGASLPWAANERIRTYGAKGGLHSLKTDGVSIFGTGYSFSDPTARFEGSFSVNPDGGTIRWVNDCLGDSYDTAAMDGVIYTASHNHGCLPINEYPDSEPRNKWIFLSAAPDRARGTIQVVNDYTWDFRGLPYAGWLNWYPELDFGTATPAGQAAWSVEAADGYLVVGGEFPTVNGVKQQGLTRFAKPSIGPRKSGPQISSATTPTTVSVETGVKVSWTAGFDRDDAILTYEVLRGDTVISTQTQDSSWWYRPGMTFVDTTPGAAPNYRVRVSDPDGNSVTSPAGAVASTVLVPWTEYEDTVRADKPTHYWTMQEKGSVQLDRTGGASLTGTGVTAAQASPISGVAVKATGTSTLAANAGDLARSAASVEAWVRTSATGGGRLVGRGSDSTRDSRYRNDLVLYLDNQGRPAFASTPAKTQAFQAITGSVAINDDQWHHVVATAGPAGSTLWVDGSVAASSAAPADLGQFPGYWRLLGDSTLNLPNTPNTPSIDGFLDEVAVYPVALTADQVRRHHDAGRGIFPSSVGTDTFTRTIASGWGQADLGGTWRVTGTLNRWSVDGERGRLTLGAGSGGTATLTGVTRTSSALTMTLAADKAPTGSGQFLSVIGRAPATGTDYRLKLRLAANGTVTAWLCRMNANVETVLGTVNVPGLKYAVGDQLDARIEVSGTSPTTLKAWVWPTTGSPSGDPLLSATDSDAALQVAGQVGVYTYLPGGATNAPVTFFFDEVHVEVPDTVNVEPTASFTSTANWLDAAFDGRASADSDGTLVRHDWDFGDGTTGVGATTNHTYKAAGTYTVKLTVTDDRGATATTTRTLTVKANPAVVVDEFNRLVSAAWGSPDLGSAWTTAGFADWWKVAGGQGTLAVPTANSGATATLPWVSRTDTESLISLSTDKAPVGGSYFHSVIGRQISRGNDYRAKIAVAPTGRVGAYLDYQVGGVETVLTSKLVPDLTLTSPTEQLRVRFQVTGTNPTTLRLKVWKAAQAEPSAWLLTTTDSTASLQAPGSVALAWHNASTTAPMQFLVDHYWVGPTQP